MVNETEYVLTVNISATEWEKLYRGYVSHAECFSGTKRILVPVKHLRQFVSRTGVQGQFRLLIDENNKFIEISRV
ncbi:MAG: DUF2835 family protein [Gammaproteobacteria bacterium]|nr:DUF2835 family protein [Gammaproteobacteria bacterium]